MEPPDFHFIEFTEDALRHDFVIVWRTPISEFLHLFSGIGKLLLTISRCNQVSTTELTFLARFSDCRFPYFQTMILCRLGQKRFQLRSASQDSLGVENALEEYDLLGCIDKGLEPFGSYVKQTIYWTMTILHGSQRDGIIADPSAFAKVLQEIFDESAIRIEKSIIREIRKIFALSVNDTETLTRAIAAATEQVVLVSSVRATPLALVTNRRREQNNKLR